MIRSLKDKKYIEHIGANKNSIEYKKIEYYTIHFYDTNSHILYYIHANI